MPDLLRCSLPDPDPALAEAVRRPFLAGMAAEALAAARARPRQAGGVLARWFRENRKLGSRDRRVVSEAVYGAIRCEGLLERAGAADEPARVAGWSAIMAGERFPDLPETDPVSDYAAALSLPARVAGEWLARLGAEEAAALARVLATRAPLTARANALRCSREQLAARLAGEGIQSEPCAQAPYGLHLLTRAALPALRSFQDGWFEVQDESSQLLCEAIPVEPGGAVLDLCAGAGGKSLALAARGARVWASDVRPEALEELRKRAKRAGARIAVGKPRPAPVVLVDAPCSGTGRLRREPALRWALRDLDWDAVLARQRALLAQAAALTAPGGRLVYATCSLIAAENEHDLPGWSLEQQATLWPHQGGADGFGWRIWRRPG